MVAVNEREEQLGRSLRTGGRRRRAEFCQQNLQNRPKFGGEISLQTFLINHVEQFLVPTFCGSFWKSWWENPSSWKKVLSAKQEIFATSSLGVEFGEFQMDRSYYVDLRNTVMALEVKLIQGRGYEAYNIKEAQNEHKDESKWLLWQFGWIRKKNRIIPHALLVSHVQKTLHSIYSIVQLYVQNSIF